MTEEQYVEAHAQGWRDAEEFHQVSLKSPPLRFGDEYELEHLRQTLAEIAKNGRGDTRVWWDGKRCAEVARAALERP